MELSVRVDVLFPGLANGSVTLIPHENLEILAEDADLAIIEEKEELPLKNYLLPPSTSYYGVLLS